MGYGTKGIDQIFVGGGVACAARTYREQGQHRYQLSISDQRN